jgi:hypothetical protein
VQIKNRQQLLFILAGAVFGLLIADKLVLTPLTDAWKARTVRLADLRKKVDDGDKLVYRADALRSRWEQMRGGALTNNNSLAEQQVLEAFDKWSRDARISVNSISPQWKRDRNESFQTIECRVDASGTIGTLARFLFNLEQDPLALRIDAVDITARDKDGQNLSLGLQISGLVLNSPEERR